MAAAQQTIRRYVLGGQPQCDLRHLEEERQRALSGKCDSLFLNTLYEGNETTYLVGTIASGVMDLSQVITGDYDYDK